MMGGDIKSLAEASSHPTNRFKTEWADPDLEHSAIPIGYLCIHGRRN